MSELKRYALVGWRAFPDPDGDWVFHESARAALDSLKAQLATEREAHARTLAALHEAEEWMSSGDAIPVDGWGIRNKSADAERGAITERLRAAIAAAKVTP